MELTVEQMQNCAKVIDVSRWNIITDYHAIKRAGINHAIVKVNNAGNVPDTRFYEHMDGFRSAGIEVIGGYNYSYANTVEKAKKAATSFVRIAKPQGIDFMWLDLEDACMRGLGHTIIDIIFTYKQIAEAAGMKFGIYTGAAYYNPCLKPYAKELEGIPFWWARYPSTADRKITDAVPDPKNLPHNLDLDGWQYSSKLKVDGCKGYLDVNIWFEGDTFRNELEEITVEYNPFAEPTGNVKLGATGNDAYWVRWYLWRFGKYGNVDSSVVIGDITAVEVLFIKEVQKLLGLEADGVVGKRTKAVWKKIC